MSRAVVLLSGGIDSSLCLALARGVYDEVVALHCQYGQASSSPEMVASRAIANHFGVEFHQINLDFFKEIRYVEDKRRIVPYRNGIFLSIATGFANKIGASGIYIGCTGDDMGYPDCSSEFITAMQAASTIGNGRTVLIHTPLIHLTKPDIIRIAVDNGVPLQKTWTCYTQGEREDYSGPPTPCGVCSACRTREEAILKSGVNIDGQG